jgi:FAD binding domain
MRHGLARRGKTAPADDEAILSCSARAPPRVAFEACRQWGNHRRDERALTSPQPTSPIGSVTYRPAVVVKPQTVDDVVRVVSDWRTYPSPVRAVGKLHSPAPCSADDGGTMLDMTGMTRILKIGEDFVTAETGALYIDVAEELARHAKQFHVNIEISNITLGAVACAATKDSSLALGAGELLCVRRQGREGRRRGCELHRAGASRRDAALALELRSARRDR